MQNVAAYLESLPGTDAIREQLERNDQERKLLQKLLRIADQRERLPASETDSIQREAAHA